MQETVLDIYIYISEIERFVWPEMGCLIFSLMRALCKCPSPCSCFIYRRLFSLNGQYHCYSESRAGTRCKENDTAAIIYQIQVGVGR